MTVEQINDFLEELFTMRNGLAIFDYCVSDEAKFNIDVEMVRGGVSRMFITRKQDLNG